MSVSEGKYLWVFMFNCVRDPMLDAGLGSCTDHPLAFMVYPTLGSFVKNSSLHSELPDGLNDGPFTKQLCFSSCKMLSVVKYTSGPLGKERLSVKLYQTSG